MTSPGFAVLALVLLTSCATHPSMEERMRANTRALPPTEDPDPSSGGDAVTQPRYGASVTLAETAEPSVVLKSDEVLAPFDGALRIARGDAARSDVLLDVTSGMQATGPGIQVKLVEASTATEGQRVFHCPRPSVAISALRSCVWTEGTVDKVDPLVQRVRIGSRVLPFEAPLLVPLES